MRVIPLDIGAGIARRLGASGRDIAFTYLNPYEARMPWGAESGATGTIEASPSERGAAGASIEVERRLGPVTAQRGTGRIVGLASDCSREGQWVNGQLLMSNGVLA
ncbi:hypothetical protein [Streptomyces canus]|uniref:hypothetical protein n=1 Tax=Streptomyces canus TaxID=58343 RepID=UPI00035C38EF|nr:hypothetical protein [Streptomyces canus]